VGAEDRSSTPVGASSARRKAVRGPSTPQGAGARHERRLLAVGPVHGKQGAGNCQDLASPRWHSDLLGFDNDTFAHLQDHHPLFAASP